MEQARASRDGERLILSNAHIRIEASLDMGSLTFGAGRWRPLAAAQASVELDDGRVLHAGGWSILRKPSRFRGAHSRGVRAELVSEEAAGLRLRLELAVCDDQPYALLRLGVENQGRRPVRMRRLSPVVTEELDLKSPPREWQFYRHGWQSWSPSLSLSGRQRDVASMPPMLAPEPPPDGRGVFASDEIGVLRDPASGRSLLLGFVTAREQWTQVRLDAGRRSIEAVANADGARVSAGETLWSERLLLDLRGEPNEQLARYGEALGREMGARVPVESATGWCSWYYYFSTVSEADVLKNLRFLAEQRERLPLEYVQVDDGYQAKVGDWLETNEKFPHGMRWLAGEIREAGFRPAIWLAPFLVAADSKLFAEYPDWVVRDDAGKPIVAMRWAEDCYALDTTHPGALAWLRRTFHTITERWGYDYVKIDFLYAAAIAGRRRDREATRIEAYRRGLQAAREAVGDQFVLGCGALVGPSVGLVDGHRIAADVAPWWRFNRPLARPRGRPQAGGEPSTENALRNVLTRTWTHGRLWANDPDCLLARRTRSKLTLPEVRSLATAIAMSGGMVLPSDDMPQLSRDRLDIVSLLLPPLGEAAVVPDLLESEMPARMELDVKRPFESWRLVAAFNWSGRRQTVRVALPPGRWHGFGLWEARYWGEGEGELSLPETPPHGVRLLALRRALPRPQVLGTTFHFSMGGREIERATWEGRRRTLRLRLTPVAKPYGEVFVHVPRGFRFAGATLDGQPVEASRPQASVLAFGSDLREPRELVVRFEPASHRGRMAPR